MNANIITTAENAATAANMAKYGNTSKAYAAVLKSRTLAAVSDGALVNKARALKSSDFTTKEEWQSYRNRMDSAAAALVKHLNTEDQSKTRKAVTDALSAILDHFVLVANVGAAKYGILRRDVNTLCTVAVNRKADAFASGAGVVRYTLKSAAALDALILDLLYLKFNGYDYTIANSKSVDKYHERLAKAAEEAKKPAEQTDSKPAKKSAPKAAKSAEKQTAPEQTVTAETAAA